MHLPVDKEAAELANLYHAADARIRGLIENAVRAGIDPKTGELRRVGTKNFYTRQLAEVRKVLVELQTGAIPKATALVGTAYVQGATYVDEALGTTGAFAGVHRQAVETLADNMANGLNEAASTVGRQAEDVFRSVGLKESALGLLEGVARKDVSKSMVDNLVHEGVTSFVDKAGRRWSLGAYAQMVARTTTREAVSVGTANRLVENGHDLVTISRHAHDNDECSDYEGKTFSLSGNDSTYPELDRMPPFHPNCVHVLTPAEASFEQFEQAVGAADARDDRAVALA